MKAVNKSVPAVAINNHFHSEPDDEMAACWLLMLHRLLVEHAEPAHPLYEPAIAGLVFGQTHEGLHAWVEKQDGTLVVKARAAKLNGWITTMPLELIIRNTVACARRMIETASDGNGNPKAPTSPADAALTADHESILALLATTPTKCRTVIDVAGIGPIRNRETVGRLLRELAEFGMVDRPHGIRKGYTLTDAGRKRLPGATPT